MKSPFCLFRVLCPILLGVGLAAGDPLPRTVFVDADASGSNNGSSWPNAFTSIDDAVKAAADGDLVLVTNGTYVADGEIAVSNAITVRSVNGPDVTIVDGGYPDTTNRCFHLSHVDAAIDGFTVMNGRTSGSRECGGGVKCSGGGTVRNCTIVGNYSVAQAGGVDLEWGGVVRNCRITGNTAEWSGGGVRFWYGGTIEDSVINGNIALSRLHSGGGGIASAGPWGRVRNCTIAGNSSGDTGGGIRAWHAISVENTVIAENHAPDSPEHTGVELSYSCAAPLAAGEGNIDVDPLFTGGPSGAWTAPARVDTTAGRSTLTDGSACWHPDALVGKALNPNTNQCLQFWIVSNGLATITVRGNVGSLAHPGDAYRIHDYHPGIGSPCIDAGNNAVVPSTAEYDVAGNPRLLDDPWTSDSGHGTPPIVDMGAYEFNAATAPTPVHYVSLSGSHTAPFASWATAASNVQDAVHAAADGDTVLVSQGTYVQTEQVAVSKGIELLSTEGAAATIIDGNTEVRCLYVAHPDAVVDGFTLTRGNPPRIGDPPRTGAFSTGGGVYCRDGTVQHCVIATNQAQDAGGGLDLRGGLIRGCVVVGNSARNGGGGNVSGNGLLHSCLIVDNESWGTPYAGGGGLILGGAAVFNCTIVGNRAAFGGGGVYSISDWAMVENCIIWGNMGGDGNHQGVVCRYTCTTPLAPGEGNTDRDPMFAGGSPVNYRLGPSSPCIDAGRNHPWMADAVDLDGHPRILNGTANMGAYESVFVPTNPTPLVSKGAIWKYLDDGSDQRTAWRDPSFDDGDWTSGPAQLGYGDGDEATVVDYGADPRHKHITTYFRKVFDAPLPETVGRLTLDLLRDDGAVVYLNGTEALRSNMRRGKIRHRTRARHTVAGNGEDEFTGHSLDPTLLVTGRNVLAVEIHQVRGSSSDISFDCELTATPRGAADTWAVSGQVRCHGQRHGEILVEAFTGPHGLNRIAAAQIPEPGPYTIDGLPSGGDYWIRAYLDGNGNGRLDRFDPVGTYRRNPIRDLSTDLSGIDLRLRRSRCRWEGGDETRGIDSDGDGMSDENEERAGTLALEDGDVFRIIAAEHRNEAREVIIRWTGVDGKSYTVSRATTLSGGFEIVATNVIGISPISTYTDRLQNAGPVFYRVETQ